MNRESFEEIKRLNFENLIWIAFVILSLLNIYGDNLEKDYLTTNNKEKEKHANSIFEITLIITFFIYIYFFQRNYKAYHKASLDEKKLYLIKLLGSSFLIAGVICLLYFQTKNSNFIGGPAL